MDNISSQLEKARVLLSIDLERKGKRPRYMYKIKDGIKWFYIVKRVPRKIKKKMNKLIFIE